MGIDNHVIALYELSKLSVAMSERGQLPEFFTDSMWTKLMNFPLSTSQVTERYSDFSSIVQDHSSLLFFRFTQLNQTTFRLLRALFFRIGITFTDQ